MTPQVSLVPIDSEMRKTLDASMLYRYHLGELTQITALTGAPEWVLVAEEGPEPNQLPEAAAVLNSMLSLVDCMRAFKPRYISFPIDLVLFEPGVPPGQGWPNPFSPTPMYWLRAWGKPYALEPAERDSLASLCLTASAILAREPKGPLSIALHRMGTTQQSWTDEDRVVDSTMALEALLIEGSGREIGYRLALRAARLVGNTADEREALLDRFQESYNARSRIVHGEGYDFKGVSGDEVVELSARVVRRYIESIGSNSRKSFLHSLDRDAVRGG